MSGSKDKLLSNAGGLFVAAGFIAAFTGGIYGLSNESPGTVVLSVLLLMGYSVIGYLLINKGQTYFRQALPIAAALVFATLLLFREDLTGQLGSDFTHFFLYPGLTLVLSYAGGAVLTHALETSGSRTPWPGRRSTSLNVLLHVAAFAPIWAAFALIYLFGDSAPLLRVGILAVSIVVAVAAVAGGYASVRGGHPGVTVVGAGLAFVASAFYLFEFMLQVTREDVQAFGNFVSLLGLLLTAVPVAVGAVAWIQLENGDAQAEDEPQPLP